VAVTSFITTDLTHHTLTHLVLLTIISYYEGVIICVIHPMDSVIHPQVRLWSRQSLVQFGSETAGRVDNNCDSSIKVIKGILPARLLNNINYLPLVVYHAFFISKMDLQTWYQSRYHSIFHIWMTKQTPENKTYLDTMRKLRRTLWKI